MVFQAEAWDEKLGRVTVENFCYTGLHCFQLGTFMSKLIRLACFASILIFSSLAAAQDPLYDVTDHGVTFLLPTKHDRRLDGSIPYTFARYSYDWMLVETGVESNVDLDSGHAEVFKEQIYRREETNSVLSDILTTRVSALRERPGFYRRTERHRMDIADLPGAHKKSIIELAHIHRDETISIAAYHRPRAQKGEPTRQNYSFATYDDELSLKAVAHSTFDYPRLSRALTVFDTSRPIGETLAGTAFILERVPFFSKKKQDPVITNYYLVYIDQNGKKIFQAQFNFGMKKFALEERAAFLADGEFKLLARDVKNGNAIGVIRFDREGNELGRSGFLPGDVGTDNVQSLTGDASRLKNGIYFDRWEISEIVSDEEGNRYLVGQIAEWQGTESDGDFQQRDVYTYQGALVVILNADDSFKAVRLFDRWNIDDTSSPAKLFPLAVKNGSLVFAGEIPNGEGTLRLMRADPATEPQISEPLADGVGFFNAMERRR